MSFLHRLFYKSFLRYHSRQVNARTGLKYAFTDVRGKQYHTFENLSDMPHCRRERILNAATFLNAKISEESLETIADSIITANQRALLAAKPEDASRYRAKVEVLANELKLRKDSSLPMSITIEVVALMCIRTDETPEVLDNNIHEQKIQQFSLDLQSGNAFFLKLPIFRRFLGISSASSVELPRLFAQSELEEAKLKARITQIMYDCK